MEKAENSDSVKNSNLICRNFSVYRFPINAFGNDNVGQYGNDSGMPEMIGWRKCHFKPLACHSERSEESLLSDAAKLNEPEFYLEHHKDKLVILYEIPRNPER
jgi:hypothetical protein